MGSHCCVCRTETFCILWPIIFLPLSISYLHKSNEMSPHSTNIYGAPTVLCVLRPWRCSRAKRQRSSPSQASPVLGGQTGEINKGNTQRWEGVMALYHCLTTATCSAAADTQADHLLTSVARSPGTAELGFPLRQQSRCGPGCVLIPIFTHSGFGRTYLHLQTT